MALKIRLSRGGAKKRPYQAIDPADLLRPPQVVEDHRADDDRRDEDEEGADEADENDRPGIGRLKTETKFLNAPEPGPGPRPP